MSDFSDYDSSDAEWQAAHGSGAVANKKAPAAGPSSRVPREYASLEDDYPGQSGLLEKEDDNPFGDPFADELDTPVQEKQRLQCECGLSFIGIGRRQMLMVNLQGLRSK